MLPRAAQRARQEALARELGLIPPDQGVLVSRSKNPYPDIMLNQAPLKRVEREPCPCQKAGSTSGREKLATGWCIDGKFWPFHALNVLRMVRDTKGQESASKMKNALSLLNDELDLDLAGLTISNHVRQHEAS